MADFINTIDALGDDAVSDSIINRTITEFKDDRITKVGQSAFQKCTSLKTLDIPSALTINYGAFYGCTALSSINIPAVTSINAYNAFSNCKALTKVVLPVCTNIGNGAFSYCTALKTVDCKASGIISFGNTAFGSAPVKALVIRSNSVATMANTNALLGTDIYYSKGYIYVPASLKSQYEQAANWSTYADQFRKLEEWTVDGTVTGALIDDAANKHIVHFYNSDGTPLGYTIVAAGSDAVYSGADPVDPAGSGNPFGGFEPAPTNVTADMDCYATFKDAWDEVFASIADGTYKTRYAVGDTVPLDLGTEGVINMQIAAFDTDDLADGSGKAPITWISKEGLNTTHIMNPGRVTLDDGTYQEGTGCIGGWEKCEMRTYLKETIKPLIPATVQSMIKTVTKYSDSYDTAGAAVDSAISQDDVWIPSCREVGFGRESLGPIYSALFTDNASRIRYISGSATVWWLRTSYDQTGFRTVKTTGTETYMTTPTSTRAVVLCFCT